MKDDETETPAESEVTPDATDAPTVEEQDESKAEAESQEVIEKIEKIQAEGAEPKADEPATPDEPDTPPEPTTDEISPATLSAGIQLGIDGDYLKYLYEEKGSSAVKNLMDRASATQAQYVLRDDDSKPVPEVTTPDDESKESDEKKLELNEDDYDPATWKALTAISDRQDKAEERQNQTETKSTEREEATREAGIDAVAKEFDRLAGSASKELLGEGDWSGITPGSTESENRFVLLENLDLVTKSPSYANQTFEQRFEHAMRLSFPEQTQNKALKDKVEDATKRTLMPNGRNGAKGSTPEQRAADVVKDIEEIMAQ